jgi:hypothetical protein
MPGTTNLREQRIRAVFSGRQPDRIPICEQCFCSSVASAALGREAHTGTVGLHYFEALAWLRGESAHQEFVEQVYEDSWALTRHYDYDIWFWPWLMGSRPTRRIDEYTLLYGNEDGDDWSLWKFDPGSYTYGMARSGRPPATGEQVLQWMRDAIAGPRETSPVRVEPIIERAVRAHGHEHVIAGHAFLHVPMQAGWLEAVALEPALVGEWLDLTVERELASFEAQRKLGIFFLNGGGDFAFKSGPVYSPAFFQRIMAPRWKRLFDACRASGLYYVMRSDGNLWPVADALFGQARPHAYYECDYDAGMRFADLRRAFPELVLIGNVSCPLLLSGTPEQVRERTLECVEAAAPRVIIASANSILHGTPPENVSAMYEAARLTG